MQWTTLAMADDRLRETLIGRSAEDDAILRGEPSCRLSNKVIIVRSIGAMLDSI